MNVWLSFQDCVRLDRQANVLHGRREEQEEEEATSLGNCKLRIQAIRIERLETTFM